MPLVRIISLSLSTHPLRAPHDHPLLTRLQYNGAKQLYVNRALAYSVKKECTDGNLNSWVIPLPFGRAVLRLTSKLFASSGFEYVMTLDNDDRGDGGGVGGGGGTVLYKSTQ